MFDNCRNLDTGNDLDGTAAMSNDFNLDIEHAFEKLCPTSLPRIAVPVSLPHIPQIFYKIDPYFITIPDYP